MTDPGTKMTITFGAATVLDQDTAEEVLEGLYDQYARSLYRYALALVGSADDAEDAVQEVFVRLAREYRRLKKIANMKAYLFTATRNAAFSVLRSRRRATKLETAVSADLLTRPDFDTFGQSMQSAALITAFAELPIEQREVIVLKVYDQLTFEEIGKTVGISINTAGSRYRYGIARLRQALEKDNG